MVGQANRRASIGKALRTPTLLLAFLLVSFGAIRIWDLGRRSPGIDFYQFWVVAQVAGRADLESVYHEESRVRIGSEFLRRAYAAETSPRQQAAARSRIVLETFGTPFLYTVFRPLAGRSYERDYRLYRLIALVSTLTALLVLCRLLGYPMMATLVFVALVLYAFQPLQADVRVGNVNQLQLGTLVAYIWLGARRDGSPWQLAAGAVLGAAVLFKPNLLGIVPLLSVSWYLRHAYRKLALQIVGLSAGVIMGTTGSSLVFGSHAAWRDWVVAAQALPSTIIPLERGNFGIARIIHESLNLEIAPYILFGVAGALLACLWLGRPRMSTAVAEGAALGEETVGRADDTLLVGAGCLGYLLAAPLVWQHYLLLTLPLVLFLLRPGHGDEEPVSTATRRVLAGAAFTAIAIDPYADLLEVRALMEQAMVVSAGLVLLFSLTLWEILRPRSPTVVTAQADSPRAGQTLPRDP